MLDQLPEADSLFDHVVRVEFVSDVIGYRITPGLIRLNFNLFASFRYSKHPDKPQSEAERTLTRALRALLARHNQ